MPRISDRFLDCVTYVYPSEDAAYRGAELGGAGFLYGVPVEDATSSYRVFLVTCRHVLRGKEAFIRINTIDGGFKILHFPQGQWIDDPTEDLAAAPIAPDPVFKPAFVRGDTDLVDADLARRMNFGPGEDVFVVGRFPPHEGKGRNSPIVRFGCIAMMPYEPIYNKEIELETLCYLIDVRIRKGFSGSPVFLQYSDRLSAEGSERSGPWSGERLLGLCWGLYEGSEHVKDTSTETALPGYSVDLPEGLACVAPSSRIDELVRQWAG